MKGVKRGFSFFSLLIVMSMLLSLFVFAQTINPAPQNQITLAPTPYFLYNFNDNPDTTVDDASGNSRQGTLVSNPTYTGSVYYGNQQTGSAASLNGGNYLYTDVSASTLGNNQTISLWVRFNDLTSDQGVFQWTAVNEPTSQLPFILVRKNGDKLSYYVNGNYQHTTSAGSIKQDQWHHVAVTRSQGGFGFYLDGNLESAFSTFGNTVPAYLDRARRFYAGTGFPATSNSVIDEVRFYTTAFTPQEVNDILYKNIANELATRYPNYAREVAYYPLDGDGRDVSTTPVTASIKGNPAEIDAPYQTGFYLDGDGDFIAIPDNAKFDFTDGFAVAMWIKINDSNIGYVPLITEDDQQLKWEVAFSDNLGTQDSIFVQRRLPSGAASTFTCNLPAGTITDQEWHHLVVAFETNQTAGSYIIYRDGILCDRVETPPGQIQPSNNGLRVGKGVNGRFFKGSVDSVFFFAGGNHNHYYYSNLNRVGTFSSCVNGIQDGNEEDVDCGGNCITQCQIATSNSPPTTGGSSGSSGGSSGGGGSSSGGSGGSGGSTQGTTTTPSNTNNTGSNNVNNNDSMNISVTPTNTNQTTQPGTQPQGSGKGIIIVIVLIILAGLGIVFGRKQSRDKIMSKINSSNNKKTGINNKKTTKLK